MVPAFFSVPAGSAGRGLALLYWWQVAATHSLSTGGTLRCGVAF